MRPLAAKPDLTMLAHDAIRTAILSGDLRPMAPLAQEELAERLGVSRQPVSHALLLLRREGLVIDRGRKGQMVAPIDPEQLLSLYQVRGALDRLAARLAAERLAAGEGDGTGLRAALETGRAAAESGDVAELVAADVSFHQEILTLSGNPEIGRTAETFWPHMLRSMRVVLEDRDRWGAIWDEHAAIAEAVLTGEVERAAELAAGHNEMAGLATHRRLTSE